MSRVGVEYVDELYCRINADRETISDIADEITFFVEGFEHMPKFKAGQWDGKIRLLNKTTRKIYKNLLPKVFSLCREQGHDFMFDSPKESFLPPIQFDSTWIDRWNEYGQWEPFKHQKEYFNGVMSMCQALALAPTSSGKSYIIYLCIRYILENIDEDILLCVPSTSLVEQMFSDFKDYAGDLWDVEANCQKLYGGMEKERNGRRVLISTWQSVYKNPKHFFDRFDALIVDEAHMADGESLSGIVDKMTSARYRLGFTGTLDGSVVHELELTGRFGPVVKKVTTRQLMDLGLVAQMDIKCYRLVHPPEFCALLTKKDYKKEIDMLIAHEPRNKFIIETAMKSDGNSLILFNYVEKHGKPLQKYAESIADEHGKKVLYISGSVKTENREAIRKAMEEGDNLILLASYGTLSTGVSIKNIMHVFFAHPFKGRIRNLQSIGRGLRLRPGKDRVTLHDIGDDLVTNARRKKRPNFTLEHLTTRIGIYREEDFDYDVIQLVL